MATETAEWPTTWTILIKLVTPTQWRRQRSKGARSFRCQKILQPGHPDALFSKKVDDLFLVVASKHWPPTLFHRQNKTNKAVRYVNIFIFCSHYYRSKTIRRAKQGGARAWARAVDLPARSFDLARPGVAPLLLLHRDSVKVERVLDISVGNENLSVAEERFRIIATRKRANLAPEMMMMTMIMMINYSVIV